MRNDIIATAGFLTALALSLAAAAPPAIAGTTPAGKLVVSAAFSPNPPSSKKIDTITVSVKDAEGKPVRGATVKIATSMPTMSMKGAELVARDRGNGTYTANTKLVYATTWAFDISATAKGRNGTARIEKVLK